MNTEAALARTPEPELMDDPAQALAYARGDFEEPHNHFVALFRQHFGDPGKARALDLGCGPGDISRRFARAFTDCSVVGVDGAQAMLDIGERDNALAGLGARVQLLHGYLPDVELPEARYDAVISNSLLHHLADPLVLWRYVRRYAAAGAPVFVMDLMRPATRSEAEWMLGEYAASEPEVLRQDFFNSLLAAYRVDEVRAQLDACELDFLDVAAVSDRHLLVHGRMP